MGNVPGKITWKCVFTPSYLFFLNIFGNFFSRCVLVIVLLFFLGFKKRSKEVTLLHTFHFDILLILSLPLSRWAGANTDLPLSSNISKTVKVGILFIRRIFNKLSNDIQVDRLCTCGSLVIDV